MASKTSKKLGILVSIVAIALCVVLITGSTFSLFTSETNADITISAGEVKLTADIDDSTFALYSLDVDQGKEYFANGGKATLSGADLTLENVTPGDRVEFDIVVDNDSTVLIQYRITWVITGELAEYLVTNVDNSTSQWAEWAPLTAEALEANPDAQNVKTHHVSVELPKEIGNIAMTMGASITFYLEAVQANATGLYSSDAYVSTADGLQAALDAGATEIYFNNNIETDAAIVIPGTVEVETPDAPELRTRKRAEAETEIEGVVFYMNGHSLTANGDTEVIVNNGTLTIVEGSIVSKATEGAAIVNNGAVTIVESEIKLAPETEATSTATAIANSGSMSFVNTTVIDKDGKVTDYKDISESVDENGFVIRTDAERNEVIFRQVVAEANVTEVVIPEGVTTIDGYAFAYNTGIEKITLASTVTTLADRAFRDTSASVVVLNEGLTNISYQAFRNAANVTTVAIPASVKTISDSAFQNSGITALTVPATVTTIEYGAMRDMKMLETVTLEGNADIPKYAFRACTNLKTVYINGDDVTFGNNGTSRGMIFTNKENGDGSAITIYVKNETVKARLLAQDTAAKDYGGYTIVCPLTVTTADELLEALANAQPGAVINANGVTIDINTIGVDIPSGAKGYTLPGDVTIQELNVIGSYRGGNYLIFGGSADQQIVFEDCSFATSNRAMGFGLIGNDGGATSVVYNNCTFAGPIITNFVDNTAGVATFNNCTFKKATSGNSYVMAMGGKHVFNACTFDYTGATQSNMGTINTCCVNSVSDGTDSPYATVVELVDCTRINCGTRTYGSRSTLTIK